MTSFYGVILFIHLRNCILQYYPSSLIHFGLKDVVANNPINEKK